MKRVKSKAPGRINIIGEHTDYNDGFVFPAAIDHYVHFTLEQNNTSNEIELFCEDSNETFSSNLNELSPSEKYQWANYLMAVLIQLKAHTTSITGFKASFRGDVPIGSGVSSSAALECSFAIGLNGLFNLGLTNWQLIKACQYAEHSDFVGTKCGVMDQFASVMGKANFAMLLDCQSLEFEYVPIDLGPYIFLLINSNVKHSLAESEYNTRREECENALAYLKNEIPELKSFRELNMAELSKYETASSGKSFNRVKHILSENQRVQQAKEAILFSDFEKLGALLYESHESLSSDYQVSCTELDFLVNLSKTVSSILGARMMGGGFGGCTINLVQKDKVEEITELMGQSYFNEFQVKPTFYQYQIGDGASVLTEN